LFSRQGAVGTFFNKSFPIVCTGESSREVNELFRANHFTILPF
jgi:hypothetical protein